MFKKLILIQLVVHTWCSPSSVLLKSGLNNGEAQQQHQNADNHNVQFKVGTSGYSSQGGYDKGNNNNHVSAQDEGKYLEQNSDKKQNSDEEKFSNNQFENGQGGAVSNLGHEASHKKGHHKTGFHNSYHKDESGSNSSYYDDSDNSGDEVVRNSNQNNYGGSKSEANQGSSVNQAFNAQQDNKQGGYDKGGSLVKENANNLNYNREKAYNNEENSGKVNAGNGYDSSGGRYENQFYYNKPHPYYYEPTYNNYESYYDPYYYPQSPQKRIITVYEDPRVYEQSVDYPQYERYPERGSNYYADDLIQLDIRPPLTRDLPKYYDRRGPVYENYPY